MSLRRYLWTPRKFWTMAKPPKRPTNYNILLPGIIDFSVENWNQLNSEQAFILTHKTILCPKAHFNLTFLSQDNAPLAADLSIIPSHIEKPEYALTGQAEQVPRQPVIWNAQQIEKVKCFQQYVKNISVFRIRIRMFLPDFFCSDFRN